MQSVKRWRYKCDFCGKWGGSKYHMKSHEKHCTLNPNRKCRVCALEYFEDKQTEEISVLLATLPGLSSCRYKNEWGGDEFNSLIINEFLPALRKASGDCPACIMAALRQKGIPVTACTDFDFKKEMESIFSELRESQQGGCYR